MVDYCLLECSAAYLVKDCETLEHHPLNLSDHLPLSIHLDLNLVNGEEAVSQNNPNWKKARVDGSVAEYTQCVHDGISNGYISDPPPNINEMNNEIECMATFLKQSAIDTIPAFKARKSKKRYIKDEKLKTKCNASRDAWRRWKNCGHPRSGMAYDLMKEAKKEVKQYVSICRAREERAKIQRRDQLFKNRDSARFNVPRRKTTCNKLIVDKRFVSEKAELLDCWKTHFSHLAESQLDRSSPTAEGVPHITTLYARSFSYDDQIVDTPFTTEEIEEAVKKLKCGKSGGVDGLQPEHIKYGGHSLILWLQRIFNAIVALEDIPPCLKLGVTVPVFKGKGRDPLIPSSYRGITLTSVIAKCLEIALLNRLSPILEERSFPHYAQTAYRRGVSCTDAIFATQEAILKHIREDEKPTICFFDLEKAFDSIEYATLLDHLFNVGINGKCWRLMKNWYTDSMNMIKLENTFSSSFPVYRGVKQGSVLSPTLFIMVMDSLLKQLEATGQGLHLFGLDVGSTAHADDIRAVSSCPDAARVQGNCVRSFCAANSLSLNTSKTEAVTFSRGPFTSHTVEVDYSIIQTQSHAKCLGVWWQHDLNPSRSVEENISKARRAFFALGSIGSFLGKLNPLSARSVYEIFVITVLLYGCETWILTSPLLNKLEKFQSEIGRRILKLSKHHADLAPIIGLHLPSMKVRILLRKLHFLAKLLESEEDDLSSRVFRTLSADNVFEISLVEQCKWLQNELRVDPILQRCLSDPATATNTVKSAKRTLLNQDWKQTINAAKMHSSLRHIVCSDFVASSWCRLWDQALDLGIKGTRLTQCLFHSLCRPTFGDRLCPHCTTEIPRNQSYFEHLNFDHLDNSYDQDEIETILEEGGQLVMDFAKSVSEFHHSF